MHCRDFLETNLFLGACMACEPGSVPSDASYAPPGYPAAAASTWLKRLAAETACSRFEVALLPSGALLRLVTRNFEWRRVDVSPGAGCTVSLLVSQHCIFLALHVQPIVLLQRFQGAPSVCNRLNLSWPRFCHPRCQQVTRPQRGLHRSELGTQGSPVKVQVPVNH